MSDAIQILTGAEAVVIGRGGISSAGGSVTLLVRGSRVQLHAVRKLVEKVKGEPDTKIETDCSTCKETHCGYIEG